MYLLKKPDKARINNLIQAQSHLGFSYPEIGATRHGDYPAGFVADHNRLKLGCGKATFEAARDALCRWEHYRFNWIELHRPNEQPATGQTVAALARALGLWILNVCRIVYVIEEETPIRRFAFAYGTLPEHAESGEERFQVEWNQQDDSVWYDIFAFSRPNQWLARIGYPYVRKKQRQFASESKLAMQSALTGHR